MNKSRKIVIAFIIVMILAFSVTSVYASKVSIDRIKDNAAISGGNEIAEIGSYVYSGITGVGIILSVVVIAILGVKYMMGSAEEKAEYKKSMMPYLIGAALVFGASAIARAVVGLAG